MLPSKRFINSIIPIMTIKHDKKKKNAMSGSEELVNVVRQLILIIDRINKNIRS
jgi:hypothetical protein